MAFVFGYVIVGLQVYWYIGLRFTVYGLMGAVVKNNGYFNIVYVGNSEFAKSGNLKKAKGSEKYIERLLLRS
ncbi:MAG TPA: hypothetical protein ENJ95_19085 [Bacteroidetes bacterium]|nr:hypothetical protein [Bacteroidota bacterium]